MNPVDDKNVAAQIAKLYELHQSGALSDTEFENAKRRVLGSQPPQSAPQPPTREYTYEEESRPRSRLFHLVRGFAIGIASFVALFIVLVVAVAIFGDGDSDRTSRSNSQASVSATVEPTTAAPADPTSTPEPTATAIPREGIQTIRLSITTQDGWEAWGEGCVGGGDVSWAKSGTGVVVAPSDASGTFQGRNLGAGTIDDTGRCHWSATLTTRASDAYRIKVGDYDAVCHSNMMYPFDDGFFAAVILDGDGIQCATVTDVSDTPEGTP